MGRRDQIDVRGALCLQIPKDLHKVLRGESPRGSGSGRTSGNCMVLAENAAHVTAVEKDRTAPLLSADAGLFIIQKSCSRRAKEGTFPASSCLSVQTVRTAFPRAENAVGKIQYTGWNSFSRHQ